MRDRAAPERRSRRNITERITGTTTSTTSRTSTCPSTARRSCSRCAARSTTTRTRKTRRPGRSGNTTSRRDDLHRVIASDTIAERRQRRRAALPAGRPHRVLLHAPAPVEGDPARREQAAVRSADRRSQRSRVRAARDGRRRQRHPPDLVQPEPRPATPTVLVERPRAVEPLGPRARQGRHASLYGQPGRHRLQLLYGANSHNTGTRPTASQHPVRAPARDAGRPHPHARSAQHTRRRTSAATS